MSRIRSVVIATSVAVLLSACAPSTQTTTPDVAPSTPAATASTTTSSSPTPEVTVTTEVDDVVVNGDEIAFAASMYALASIAEFYTATGSLPVTAEELDEYLTGVEYSTVAEQTLGVSMAVFVDPEDVTPAGLVALVEYGGETLMMLDSDGALTELPYDDQDAWTAVPDFVLNGAPMYEWTDGQVPTLD